MLGLCIVVFNVVTLLYYDPLYLTEKDGATGPPQWIYFTCALCSLHQIRITLTLETQVGDRVVHVSKFRRRRWVGGYLYTSHYQCLSKCRKQARRTGMAGPLGEMFDHGLCAFPDACRHLTLFFHRLRRTQHYSTLSALQVAYLTSSFVLFSLRSFLRRAHSILAVRGGLLHRK